MRLPPADHSDPKRPEPLTTLRGEVVYLYAFDVANEVRLDLVAELLSAKSEPIAASGRPAPRDLPTPRPVTVEPPPPAARLCGAPIRLHVRVYEVGVVSITIRVAFAWESLTELVPLHTPVLDDGRSLDDLAADNVPTFASV